MKASNRNKQDKIKSVLRDYINENFLLFSGLDAFKDTDSFLEKGIIDSTGLLELIGFIEEEFNIRVEDEETMPDNLDSLNNLASYIRRKLENAG